MKYDHESMQSSLTRDAALFAVLNVDLSFAPDFVVDPQVDGELL